ncbi:hypothetical protein Bca52824_007457 [Brassica carinata]|uniref:TF-B3 domain-containing protein n=1 Tax=Brassica carinata TaxID=52824 RepID=A0A8X8B5D9_BRACI|nr:hypothetical protein Bca52824_007457 [Brassica carinata]
MVFHVTPFGPSCCEIQYTHPHIIKEEADADDAAGDDAGDADDNEHHHKIRGTGAMSSFSFDYCFLAEVTALNLKEDKLYLPVGATSSTALNKQCQEMILVHKEGNSWTVSLRFSESGGMYYITRGWRKFCLDNRCEIGDLFVFNLIGDGKTTPLLCVCPESKECSELLSKYLSRKRVQRRCPAASESACRHRSSPFSFPPFALCFSFTPFAHRFVIGSGLVYIYGFVFRSRGVTASSVISTSSGVSTRCSLSRSCRRSRFSWFVSRSSFPLDLSLLVSMLSGFGVKAALRLGCGG